LKEAVSGLNGAKPAAIRSALMNLSVWASAGKKSRANVVLPAPLGPAMMMIFFKLILRTLDFMLCGSSCQPEGLGRICSISSVLLVTKKDLLDLDSINPSDLFMGHLGICVCDLID
jgi:hypothetical protein